MADKALTTFTPAYQELCFQAWYVAGRPPKSTQIIDVIPEDEDGRKPRSETITKWRDELGWDWRADELDAKVVAQSEDFLVVQKVTMLKDQAAKAKAMRDHAFNYLMENGFDSSASAVTAMIRGAELERESRGLEVMITKIAKMSNSDLLKEIANVQSKLSDGQTGQILDAQEEEKKESTNNDDNT